MNCLDASVLTEVVSYCVNKVINKTLYVKLLLVTQKVVNVSYTFDKPNSVFVTWMVSSI